MDGICKGQCLSLFRWLQQNTTDWAAYKQQKCISYGSEGWEVQDQGVSMVASCGNGTLPGS